MGLSPGGFCLVLEGADLVVGDEEFMYTADVGDDEADDNDR